MEIMVLWAVAGVITAVIAHSRGRNPVGWFFIGFLLSLIGIILVIALPNLKEEREQKAHMDRENRRLREQLHQERVKNETFRQYASERLDSHDQHLNIDTRTAHAALPDRRSRGYLDEENAYEDPYGEDDPYAEPDAQGFLGNLEQRIGHPNRRRPRRPRRRESGITRNTARPSARFRRDGYSPCSARANSTWRPNSGRRSWVSGRRRRTSRA